MNIVAEQLRDIAHRMYVPSNQAALHEAADTIEAQAAEIKKLRAEIERMRPARNRPGLLVAVYEARANELRRGDAS